MTRAKDISKIVTDADLSGTLDVTGDLSVDNATLKVDSTNNRVGISTSSMTSKFEVAVSDNTAVQEAITIKGTQSGAYGGYLGWKDNWSGDSYTGYRGAIIADVPSANSGRLRFFTANSSTLSEKMRIDSTGRVMIGNTTEGVAGADELTVGDTSAGNGITIRSASNSSGALFFSDGTSGSAEYDGGFEYNHPSQFMRISTAGSEQMRIDASGNVGIGTSTIDSLLHLSKSDATAYSSTATDSQVGVGPTIYLENPANSNTSVGGQIVFGMRSTEAQARIGATGGSSPQLVFGTNDAEAMRIGSDGRIGVNTSNADAEMHIEPNSGGTNSSILLSNDGRTQYFRIQNNETNDALTINANDSNERMRIDASGNVLVGRTNNPSGVSNCIYALGNYGITTSSGANVFINSEGLFFRSTSSQRYKNTINDATHGLTELLTLRPVTYKGNNDADTVFGGLIAEEVHDAGLTEFVQYNDDGEPDALAYGHMVSLCIKAIQELKSELDSAKARITALENGE